MNPSYAEFSKLLNYDPNSGKIVWNVGRSNSIKAGDAAGHIDYKGYRMICIKGYRYQASRVAFLLMTGDWPKNHMDHIDHCRANNKWPNLREVTHQVNHKNRSMSKNNTSGVIGVVWHKPSTKWVAQIKVSGKVIYLGGFSDKIDAVYARRNANIKYGFHENHGAPITPTGPIAG